MHGPAAMGRSMIWISPAGATLLAGVHVFSQRLRILKGVPRSRLLSIVGGMAVAFVVLQLLPTIAEHQRTLEEAARGGPLSFLKKHVWIIVLFSMVLYYGMERLAKQSKAKNKEENGLERAEHWVFWIGMGTFALMNLLIGYMLVHHVEQNRGVQFLLLFTLAMFFKFIVNDHGLHRDHQDLYDHIGRWVLAVAVFIGWAVNYWAELPKIAPALLQSFIAGGVLLNVLKEELPDERKSRYWAFGLGAAAYAALLLAL